MRRSAAGASTVQSQVGARFPEPVPFIIRHGIRHDAGGILTIARGTVPLAILRRKIMAIGLDHWAANPHSHGSSAAAVRDPHRQVWRGCAGVFIGVKHCRGHRALFNAKQLCLIGPMAPS